MTKLTSLAAAFALAAGVLSAEDGNAQQKKQQPQENKELKKSDLTPPPYDSNCVVRLFKEGDELSYEDYDFCKNIKKTVTVIWNENVISTAGGTRTQTSYSSSWSEVPFELLKDSADVAELKQVKKLFYKYD